MPQAAIPGDEAVGDSQGFRRSIFRSPCREKGPGFSGAEAGEVMAPGKTSKPSEIPRRLAAGNFTWFTWQFL